MEWRPARQHPGFEVSEHGDVRDDIGRWRRFHMRPSGYCLVDVGNNDNRRQWLVHRLVCDTWYGPPPFDGAQAAHGDGCRFNNHYSNLRWATPFENAQDRRLHGTIRYDVIPPHAKLSYFDAEVIRTRVGWGEKQAALAREYGVSSPTIGNIVHGKSWRLLTGKPAKVRA
jgi:hypothetical protein